MRKKFSGNEASRGFKILAVDDEIGIVDSLKVVLSKLGYEISGETDPAKAIERIREEHFDLIILDFLMDNYRGDQVVAKVREFNEEVFILLLTGHKDAAPPLETIKTLDIQGYCEKSDKFDQLILFVESAIKSVILMRKNKKFEEGLNKIINAIPKIYQLQPLGNILEDILTEILPFANSNNAFILVDDLIEIDISAQNDETIGNRTIFQGIGTYKMNGNNFLSSISPELFEQIGISRETRTTIYLEYGVVLPLINEENDCIGIIYVESTDYSEGKGLLQIYARQAMASISNANLHSLVNTKKEELKRTYEDLRSNYLAIVQTLRLAVDAKDEYTRGHSDRVAFYSAKIGEALGLTEYEVELLKIGGQFHDIGKIGIKDDILIKPDKLDDHEYFEIKKHPQKGAYILSAISAFKETIPMVKYHHERMDGRGYPDGLKGEEIPLLARIVTIADAFDAMTSERHYRAKMYEERALEQLEKNSGSQFDPNIVNVFIDLVRKNYSDWIKELEYTFQYSYTASK